MSSIYKEVYFIVERAQPFKKNLHKGVKCVWNEECQKSIDQIKKYLVNPPILMPHILGKPLNLYISKTKSPLGALLAQLDEHGKEREIYYISHTNVSYEINYTSIEKA